MVPVVFVFREVDVVDDDGVAVRAMAMLPKGGYAKVAARQFSPGEEYPLVVLEARSRASHNHYFAALNEGFENIPESIAARWEDVEHFRQWALIETGWFVEKELDCDSELLARRLASFMGRDARENGRHLRMLVRGTKVIAREAKSQSAAAMAKQPFEESKKAVLDLLGTFTGTSRREIEKNAGKSA